MAQLYYAKTHIRFAGAYYRPGEVFEADPDAELQRLISLNAALPCVETMEELEQDPKAHGIADPNPVNLTDEEIEPEVVEEPPMIDIMDGISAAPAKTARKKTGRKRE